MIASGSILLHLGAGLKIKLRFDEKVMIAFLEALEAAETRKPAQVYKREVFRRYGLLGTRYDRVFTAIMYKMLRMAGVLDRAVAWALGVPVSEVESWDPLLRQSLRLAAFIAQFDDVKDRGLAYALTRYGMKYVASRLGWREARKIHRVLTKLWDNPWKPQSREEELMVKYLVPPILVESVTPLLDPGEMEEFLEALNREPVNSLRVNSLKANVEEVLRELRSSGLEAWPSERVPGVVRYRGPFNQILQRLVEEGKVVPQDESSAAAALLVDPKPGEFIVDLCAAPGGKATHMAELSRLQARIVAFDIHWDRLERMKMLVEATGTSQAIAMVKGDALNAPKILGRGVADKVLLDPPCSTTGSLHKNVDARWRLRREKIEELAETQKKMLATGVEVLKPGGRLVYTVCSVLPQEGEYVVKWALETLPVKLVPVDGPYDASPLLPGAMRAWPHRHGVTGFFYAVLEKTRG